MSYIRLLIQFVLRLKISSQQYTLIDSKDGLVEAVNHLQEANHVVLDLEGVELGEVGGALSIMILRPIGSKSPSKTYILDIAQLPVDDLTPLFDLLRADAPVKVVFDGRKDFCELHHTYGVTLGKTMDMQIAEIRLRVLQGQTPLEQVRLYPVWLRSRAVSRPSDYTDVHNIISLDHCAKKLGLIYGDKAKGTVFLVHLLRASF